MDNYFNLILLIELGSLMIASFIEVYVVRIVKDFDNRINKERLFDTGVDYLNSIKSGWFTNFFNTYTPFWNMFYSIRQLIRVKKNIKHYQSILDGMDAMKYG
jgi:hypothetical protein